MFIHISIKFLCLYIFSIKILLSLYIFSWLFLYNLLLFTRAEGEIAQYGPHYFNVLYTQNGRHLPGLFVYASDIKPSNHLHMCTILLLTKIVADVCFYGMDSSGKETRKDRQSNTDVIDSITESLPESLNVNASIDLKSAKLFVAPALRM